MGLFTPAWKSKYKDNAVKAVEKLTDGAKIAHAAREAVCWQARIAAVEKLTDQSVLAEVAKYDGNGYVRVVAAEKLTDLVLMRTVCDHFLRYNKDVPLLRDMYERLTEQQRIQKAYADIAQNDDDHDVCMAACEKVSSQYELSDVVSYAKYHDISSKAFEKLIDPTCLKFVAKGRSSFSMAAFEKIADDQTVFAHLAQHAMNVHVQKAASEKLTDQTLLADTAKCAIDQTLGVALVHKLTDPPLLADVAENAQEAYVRKVAFEKAIENIDTQHPIFVSVAKNIEDWGICPIASQNSRGIELGHQWDGCKCLSCGKKRDYGHAWRYMGDGRTEECKICGEMVYTPKHDD